MEANMLKFKQQINDVVPIFYACDDNFVKFTIVSINSLMVNASKNRKYHIYVLYATMSEDMQKRLKELENDVFSISLVCVEKELEKIGKKLPLRDYYSKTTYYRFFIAELFPQCNKAIYIDSDTVVLGDISKVYDEDISDCYVGACHEQAMVQNDVFGTYVENVLGIDRNNYFNAGFLLVNCKKFREKRVFEQFIELLGVYDFVVTQDQDYLNVICQNNVKWLNQGWNTEVFGVIPVEEKNIKIIHYIMVSKPWHYFDCRLKDYFWDYAINTSVYDLIFEELYFYTDEQKQKDLASAVRLEKLAKEETEKEDNYYNLISRRRKDA